MPDATISMTGESHDHPDLEPNGEVLADQLAKVAVRTVWSALCGDETLMAHLREVGKYTPEFETLRNLEVPEEVRAWVQANFWDPGPVRDAVQSELLRALWHAAPAPGDNAHDKFTCVPGHLIPSEGDTGDLTIASTTYSCCTPFCFPP